MTMSVEDREGALAILREARSMQATVGARTLGDAAAALARIVARLVHSRPVAVRHTTAG